jgi:hypothetical protein
MTNAKAQPQTSRCSECGAVVLATTTECGRCGADLRVWDIGEGDTVTLPNGTEVEVEAVDHDHGGTFFACTENGEPVWYYCKDVLTTD